MRTLSHRIKGNLIVSAISLSLSVPIAVQGAQNDVVLLWGTQTNSDTMLGFQGMDGGTVNLTQQTACQMAQDFVFRNLPIGAIGFPDYVREMLGDDAQSAVRDALIDLDECANNSGSSGNIWLIMTSCSMIMGSGTQWMRWTVPPFSEEASMIALDSSTGQAVFVPLETSLEELNESVGTGELMDYSMTGPGERQDFNLRVSNGGAAVRRDFTASRYEYSYSGQIDPFKGVQAEGMPASAMMAFMPKISIRSTGHSWIAPDAPGADVISTFYSNFRDHVAPAAGMGSMMTGMVSNMADIATKGIPIKTYHKTSTGAGSAGTMSGFGMSGESESTIKSIMVLPGASSGQCARTVIPDGVEVINVNQIMNDAMSGGPAGANPAGGASSPGAASPTQMSPQQQAQIAEAMQQAGQAASEMAKAMEHMTPEQKKMMEQMGLGNMMNMANPAGGAGAAAAAAGASAATASAMSSSKQLTTDNLTQTAQLHLQALGYKVGNTNGNIDTNTMIAISQFQAEKGMKVTGEISPQLVGILSAEVDSR